MPRLISREGRVEDVPDANVDAAIRAGYRSETGVDVLGASAARIVSDRQASRGPLDQVGAGALGFARGATFGLSDAIVGDPELIDNLRSDFPTTSALSEVAGAVAPALLSGGAGAAGTVARLTPAARASLVAARIGAGAEEVGALRGIGRVAAGSAFEGAAQTSGNYLSDAALHDKDLSAEAFMAEAGKGALIGGGIGGGLGAAERGFVAARRLLPKSAAQPAAVRAATDEVNAQVAQSLAGSDKAIQAAKQKLDMLRLQNADLDIAAKTRLAEKEAAKAEAAAAKVQQQAQAEAERAARAGAPPTKSSRPRKKGAAAGEAPVIQLGVGAPEIVPPASPRDFAGTPLSSIEDMPTHFGGPDAVSLWRRGDAPLSSDDVARELERNPVASRAPSDIAPSRGGIDQTAVARKPAKVISFPNAEERTALGKVAQDAKPQSLDDLLGWMSGKVKPHLDQMDAEAAAAAGPDLEALLSATDRRLTAGEDFGALGADRRVPSRSAIEPIHEAMAEIDPEAAKIVEAVKRHEAAAERMRSTFTIRDKNGTRQVAIHDLADLSIGRQKQAYLKASGPERTAILEALGPGKAQMLVADVERKATKTFAIRDGKGTRRVATADLGGETLGRIKQAYHAATDAQREEILKAIGQDKARALIELTEGRASMTTRRAGDPMRAEVTGAGPSPDELDLLGEAPEMVSVLGDDGRVVQVPVTADDLAEVNDLNSMIGDVGEYESSMADLADALGVDAPPAAMAAKQGRDAALDEQAEVSVEQMARHADQIAEAPIVEDAASVADEVAPVVDAPAVTPAAAPATPTVPLKQQIAENKVGMAAARRELKEAQIAKANLPKPAKAPRAAKPLPVAPPPTGTIAAAVMKLRGLIGVASKSSMLMPFTGLARVAMGAAKVRDKVAGAVDALLEKGAKAAGSQAVRKTAVATSWRALDVLSDRLYDDGQRRKAATMADTMLARTEELQSAMANPAGVRATILASMADVHDPRMVDAAVAVGLRKVEYLAKHMPQPPPPDVLSRRAWRPSPTDAERFARRVRAANHPLTVLEDVATGRVTAEGAETLREVYPRLYQEAQAQLISRAAELNHDLPHALVVRLAVLFDAPLVRSLQPEHMAAIQSAGVPQQPAAQPPSSAMQPPPAGAPNVADLYMTADQRRAR